MRGQFQCPDNYHTPMIQDALLLLHQQLNTLTSTTKWWTTWAGSTGRTPSGTTSTLPGLAKLQVHHPILAVVSATPLPQTNIVLPTTLLVTPTLTTMMAAPPQTYLVDGNTTTCPVLLSTPEPPGQRAPLWIGS